MEKYKDASLPLSVRVDDLLSRMNLAQKIAQLQCMMILGDPNAMLQHFPDGIGEVTGSDGSQDLASASEFNRKIQEKMVNGTSLGIPAIIHAEAVTGLNGVEATIFPSAIGLGATWDPDVVEEMTDIIRKQMVSMGVRQALSPVMDVCRDPRWGRIGETYGEDPTLCAAMSVAFTKGLQSDDLKNGASATAKHFLGYGFGDGGLNMATNPIPSRDLREVYAKPFQAAITEGSLQSVMNSYGTIDNEPIITSKHILTDLLREEMGFEGLVVSDYMSIQRAVAPLKTMPDLAAAGVAALKAGLDVECPYPAGYVANLAEALQKGELDEAVIDRSVRRVLETKFKLGLFENPYPITDSIEDAYHNPKNRAHSLKAARESTVLLKNNGILPLKKDIKKIAVIGPHADSVRLMFGCYTYPAAIEMQVGRSFGDMAGMPDMDDMIAAMGADARNFVPSEPMQGSEILKEHPDVTIAINALFGSVTPTILNSLRKKCPGADISYAKGCDIAGTDRKGFMEACNIAKEADVVILALGGKYGWGSYCTIGEGIDCDDIGLTGVQEELAMEIFNTGTPAILVHMVARPLSSVFIKENYAAVLEYWFPGITGGEALADILFGDYNPAGRLPATAARNAGQIPIFASQKNGNSDMPNPQKGTSLNKYAEGSKEPLFCFGEGISYTGFEYSNLKMDHSVTAAGTLSVSCDVKNTGSVDGEEVVQLYVSDEVASMIRPYQELAGFKRVAIGAGETKTVVFTVKADQFAFLDRDMNWAVESDTMTVRVGASSRDIRLTDQFEIEDTIVIDGKNRGFFAKAEIR